MLRTSVRALVLSSALAVAGCGVHTTEGMAKALVPDEQEDQLGQQVKQELDKQGTKYINDPEIVNYVRGVAEKIFVSANKDRPGVKWQVHVIDDPKQVNAFATPGGYLYVFSGLLMAADNEAQLAGVWGHESGHVVARHSARQMVDAMGLETVLGIALGQNPNQLAQLAGTLAAKGALLSYSRQDETEADEFGARYSAQAGYDPHGIIQFFEKLKAMEGNVPSIAKYLSDHPLTGDRITHLQQYIQEKHLTGSTLGAERLQPVKQKLIAQARAAGVNPATLR
jgi:predicted Zn-dependent protease